VICAGTSEYEMSSACATRMGHYVDIRLSCGSHSGGNADGPIVRIVGTHFDSPERSGREEALRRREEWAPAGAEAPISGAGVDLRTNLISLGRRKLWNCMGWSV